MKKYLLALLPVLVFCFGSCKKDTPDLSNLTVIDGATIPGGNNSGSNGNSSANSSYLPTTTGSSWTYKSDATGESAEAHITGVITPINGQNYYELKSNTKGKENTFQYYYVKDNKYKIVATTEQEKVTVEFFILDNNLAVGGEWTAKMTPDGLVNGIPGQTVSKVIEKGITKTVLNNTYNNVIHTRMTVQYDFGIGNGFEDFGTYDYYLAKGIGLIQTDFEFMGLKTKSYLTNYSIK
ncbi:hypothetical protein D0C36_11075 [Mucilaginibacter conchicola]|uniref:Lipoprotein n=1 Tax=Mucilaginibacter conchicola TaxID=2303333 RepID=A0A372NS69_9SPHI|nr:hypothetical protein [Mucilaginibacter conchicola]RFZ91982.1 hypothetical protein D0C36_11075 [Mucilaginibacter conchicola]